MSQTDPVSPDFQEGREPVYIIDGFNLIFRAYYAFMRMPMRTKSGMNTSAIFGFFRILASFIKNYRPHTLAVALEGRGPTFRDDLFPEYKGTRQETPEELKEQFPWIEKILLALGLPLLRVNGYEADDIMATFARRCTELGRHLHIVTADKDMLQLVDGGVSVLKPSKEGGFDHVGPLEVVDLKGVRPDQILDYLSLLGDVADNVPGVKGIGEKTAAKLLAEWDSLEGIYDNLDKITGATGKKLAEGREAAFFSRKLITLCKEVPIPGIASADFWAPFVVRDFNGRAAAEILRSLDIKGLAVELGAWGGSAGPGEAVMGGGNDSLDNQDDGSGSGAGGLDGPGGSSGSAGSADASSPAATAKSRVFSSAAPRGNPASSDTGYSDQAGTAPGLPGQGGGNTASGQPGYDRGAGESGEDGKAAQTASPTGGAVPVPAWSRALAVVPPGPAVYSPGDFDFQVVTDPEGVKDWVARALAAGCAAVDTETEGLDAHNDALCGVSLSFQSGTGAYLALRGPEGPVMEESVFREAVRPLFETPGMRLVGQNLKFDWQFLVRFGINPVDPWFDTMIAAWVLDSGSAQYGMDWLASRYLGYTPISFESLFEGLDSASPGKPGSTGTAAGDDADLGDLFAAPGPGEGSAESGKKKPKNDRRFSRVPLEKGGIYSAEDSEVTFRLCQRFAPAIKDGGFEDLFFRMEMPLVGLLARMEYAGMALEPSTLRTYSAELDLRIRQVEEEVYRLVGHPFNLASPKQLQEVLFVERKLQGSKKTKTGYSTDTSVLEELAAEDPVPAKILEFRGLSKIKSTYADTLPGLVNPLTGRIHTSLVQTGTATGRISSRDPNLQNIPIRDEDGRKIRSAFVSPVGTALVSADYAQIELVLLAHFARDPGLCAAFRDGVDVHKATAALIFGLDPAAVKPEQRRAAKTINFGVMYGMSAFRLARELGIPMREAQAFIDAYFATYSGIKAYMESMVLEARTSGGVRTLFGRWRAIPDITSRNQNIRQAAERIAVNTPIQGSAADIVKAAMLRVDLALRAEKLASRIILQVHDELIIEAPLGEVDVVKSLLEREMTSVASLEVPLRASVESGANWGDLH